jgi:hypothetical protein
MFEIDRKWLSPVVIEDSGSCFYWKIYAPLFGILLARVADTRSIL